MFFSHPEQGLLFDSKLMMHVLQSIGAQQLMPSGSWVVKRDGSSGTGQCMIGIAALRLTNVWAVFLSRLDSDHACMRQTYASHVGCHPVVTSPIQGFWPGTGTVNDSLQEPWYSNDMQACMAS